MLLCFVCKISFHVSFVLCVFREMNKNKTKKFLFAEITCVGTQNRTHSTKIYKNIPKKMKRKRSDISGSLTFCPLLNREHQIQLDENWPHENVVEGRFSDHEVVLYRNHKQEFRTQACGKWSFSLEGTITTWTQLQGPCVKCLSYASPTDETGITQQKQQQARNIQRQVNEKKEIRTQCFSVSETKHLKKRSSSPFFDFKDSVYWVQHDFIGKKVDSAHCFWDHKTCPNCHGYETLVFSASASLWQPRNESIQFPIWEEWQCFTCNFFILHGHPIFVLPGDSHLETILQDLYAKPPGGEKKKSSRLCPECACFLFQIEETVHGCVTGKSSAASKQWCDNCACHFIFKMFTD